MNWPSRLACRRWRAGSPGGSQSRGARNCRPVAVWFGCRSRRSPLAGQDRTMPYASWILFTSAGSAFERIAACSSAK